MEDNKKALENESNIPIDIITQSQGFVKLFKIFLEWEWYTTPNTMRVFVHCLLKANYRTKNWQGKIIPAGSFITGRRKMAQELGITEQQVRTAFSNLQSTREITITSYPKYSIISINNWQKFQGVNQKINQNLTNEQPTDNQLITTTKNIKNNIYSGQNKKFKKPTLQEVQNYISEIGSSIDAATFIDFYNANGWKINKNPMKDWHAALRNWERRRKEQSPQKQEEKEYVWNPNL